MNDSLSKLTEQAWVMIKAGRLDEVLQLTTGPMSDHMDSEPKPRGYANLLSAFGYASCIVQKKRKDAVDLCRQAIALDRLNPRHYFLLGRVYQEASSRRLAYDIFKKGLKIEPGYLPIIHALDAMGTRSKPVLKFLKRTHSLNIALGRLRKAVKLADK